MTRKSSAFMGNYPILRQPALGAIDRSMASDQKIDVAKLKRDIIAATSAGQKLSRRGLSLQATNGKNADLVRDLISRGQDKKVSYEAVIGLASAMGKEPSEYLIGITTHPEKDFIPVIGQVQAGTWREQSEWPERDKYLIEVDKSPIEGAERFALEMVGHSMDRTIPPGSVLECIRVFQSNGPKPIDGDIVIVERRQNDLIETTCKRLEIKPNGTYILHAESYRPEFSKPVFIGCPDFDNYEDQDTRIVAIVNKAIQQFFRRRQS